VAQSLQNVQGHRVNRVTPDRVRDRLWLWIGLGPIAASPIFGIPTYVHAVWPRVTIITLELTLVGRSVFIGVSPSQVRGLRGSSFSHNFRDLPDLLRAHTT